MATELLIHNRYISIWVRPCEANHASWHSLYYCNLSVLLLGCFWGVFWLEFFMEEFRYYMLKVCVVFTLTLIYLGCFGSFMKGDLPGENCRFEWHS